MEVRFFQFYAEKFIILLSHPFINRVIDVFIVWKGLNGPLYKKYSIYQKLKIKIKHSTSHLLRLVIKHILAFFGFLHNWEEILN